MDGEEQRQPMFGPQLVSPLEEVPLRRWASRYIGAGHQQVEAVVHDDGDGNRIDGTKTHLLRYGPLLSHLQA
jgi:hypothetical protein